MKVKFKDGGKISITDMPRALFDAVRKLMWSSRHSFVWDEDIQEWDSNGDFICGLDKEEKQALDDINWTL